MGTRRKGRILAFQALYAWDTADDKQSALKDLLDFSWATKEPSAVSDTQSDGNEDSPSEAKVFSRLLVTGTVENIEKVDEMIREHLLNWDFSRLGTVDKALLRVSIYELLFKVAPSSVVIDEAVDISREYGTDDSYRFINGVLDGIRKTIERTEKER